MVSQFLCPEGVQKKLPCLLLTLMRRKCVHIERRPSNKWSKIICSTENPGLYLAYKDMNLSALLIKKYLTFGNMYSMQKIRFHEPIKTLCWRYNSFSSLKCMSRFHTVQKGCILSDLRVCPQILKKCKGRTTILHNCLYCSVRHASDTVSVRERIAEENRKTRARFEACEKKWEELLDERLLQAEDIRIHEAHKMAVDRGHFTYDDPHTGYRVMTRLRHFLRGSCCGNACRHCVYDHANVAEKERSQRVFNSSFWVDVSTRPDLAVVASRTLYVNTHSPKGKEDEERDEGESSDPLLYKH